MSTWGGMCGTTGWLQNLFSRHEFVKLSRVAVTVIALTAGTIGCATKPMKANTVQPKVDETDQRVVIPAQVIPPLIIQQKVVEAEKIVLKDAAGNVRFEVAVKEDGSLVHTLRDAKGNERIKLMIDAEGVARHNIIDETGTTRVGSYVYPIDHPKFAGIAGTEFFNKDGKVLIQLGTENNREAFQVFFDNNGKDRISLNILNNGSAVQQFRDAAGTVRANTYTNTSGEIVFNLFDSQQRVRFRNIMFPNGKLTQGFMSKTGQYKESTTFEDDDTLTHTVEKGAVRKIVEGVGSALKRVLPGSEK